MTGTVRSGASSQVTDLGSQHAARSRGTVLPCGRRACAPGVAARSRPRCSWTATRRSSCCSRPRSVVRGRSRCARVTSNGSPRRRVGRSTTCAPPPSNHRHGNQSPPPRRRPCASQRPRPRRLRWLRHRRRLRGRCRPQLPRRGPRGRRRPRPAYWSTTAPLRCSAARSELPRPVSSADPARRGASPGSSGVISRSIAVQVVLENG